MRGYDPESVEPRLALMVREIEAIKSELPPTFEEFAGNEQVRYQLEHRLLIAVQALLDIAAHLALRQGLLTLGTYREALDQLAAKRMLSPDLAEQLSVLPGMRNALVHEYLELDARRVYAALRDMVPLEAFVARVIDSV